MTYLFLRLLPKNLLSRLIGYLSSLEIPSPLLNSVIQVYCRIYGVNLDEMKLPVSRMKSFNDFFTRELKPEVRKVDDTASSIVSPVDGTIAEFGAIKNNLLVQSKGILYSLVDLVGKKEAKDFENGYYLTIYLSPADYHRIHAPVAGRVKNFSYYSGNLWPVNRFGIENVGGLFSLNERILTPIESDMGKVGVVKVGATIVGKISLDYDRLNTNSGKPTALNLPVVPTKLYKKGDEIGLFQLGSTVILLFESGRFSQTNIYSGKTIKMGEAIGHFV
jgi:phosphatidylserine decarboxylase